MLLIFSLLTGRLFWIWRYIKNERIPFAMEWMILVIMFVIGQFAVYL